MIDLLSIVYKWLYSI